MGKYNRIGGYVFEAAWIRGMWDKGGWHLFLVLLCGIVIRRLGGVIWSGIGKMIYEGMEGRGFGKMRCF